MAMMNHRKNSPAALRFAERRRREDEAPKLHDEVKSLAGLVLEIEDRAGVTSSKYVRRVVVDSAPALFLVPCIDPRCLDGEHDITSAVMQALRSHKTTFHGVDECRGSLGPSPCNRVVHFDGVAEYRDAPQDVTPSARPPLPPS